jgi:hypothetical protein
MRVAIIGLAALPVIGAATVAAVSALRAGGRPALADEGRMPDLGGAIGWLNTAPLTGESGAVPSSLTLKRTRRPSRTGASTRCRSNRKTAYQVPNSATLSRPSPRRRVTEAGRAAYSSRMHERGARCRLALALACAIAAAAGCGPSAPRAASQDREAPPFPRVNADGWINSPPLTMAGLRGRVVVLDIWTFG